MIDVTITDYVTRKRPNWSWGQPGSVSIDELTIDYNPVPYTPSRENRARDLQPVFLNARLVEGYYV